MNSTSETRQGFSPPRVLDVTLPPLSLEPPAAHLPVPVNARPPATALERALANITKLDAAMTQAAHTRFDGRNNAFVRWTATHGKTVTLLSSVVPAVVAFGAVVALNGQTDVLAVCAAIGAGCVGSAIGCRSHEDWSKKRRGGDEPLTTAHLSSAITWLSEMPAQERALLEPYADRTLKEMVDSKSLTSPAAEVLRNTLRDGTSDLAAQVRTGRIAVLVHDAMTHGFPTWATWTGWLGEMLTVFGEAPAEERRELATTLLARCFKDELCTLPVSPSQADVFYGELRAAQKASAC